jgi:hypothetical protein
MQVLKLHFVTNMPGQKAEDFHFGIINVQLAFSFTILFIHYSISRGGETNQLLSFFQH